MLPNQLEAHLRMVVLLRERTITHERPRHLEGMLKGDNRKDGRPVLVWGVRYETVSAAARALGRSRAFITTRLMDRGEAEYTR